MGLKQRRGEGREGDTPCCILGGVAQNLKSVKHLATCNWTQLRPFARSLNALFGIKAQCDPYLQVHTRQWACSGSNTLVTCNCGVVLRDHNDVIEFNCCNEPLYFDQVTPIRVKVKSKRRLSPGISITQTQISSYVAYKVSLLLQNTTLSLICGIEHISLTFAVGFLEQSQSVFNKSAQGENFKLLLSRSRSIEKDDQLTH